MGINRAKVFLKGPRLYTTGIVRLSKLTLSLP